MKIELAPELEDLVRQKVEAGEFVNANELIDFALRLFIAHQRWPEIRLLHLQMAIREGEESGIAEDFSFEKLNAELDGKKVTARRRRA
jgi:antitoxin ParD1/3/4